MRRQGGFTLVELMISLVLFSFAIAGVLAVAVSMSQGFREQRAAVGAEGAVRVPLDFIADGLRQLSPGSPAGNIQDLNITPCAAASVLKVFDNQSSSFGGYTGWDSLEMIYASGAVVTGARTAFASGTSSLDVDDASGLAVGDSVIISDTTQGSLIKITGISGNTLTLGAQCTGGVGVTIPAVGYPIGALVIRAQHAKFTIDDPNHDGVPILLMDPDADPSTSNTEPLAEGIEDLQIALGVDWNPADGVLGNDIGTAGNDDEWRGNNAADDTGNTALAGALRAVRITLIARTTSSITGNYTPFNRPLVEDHAAATTFDGYRRRILRSTVEIRNLSGSP